MDTAARVAILVPMKDAATYIESCLRGIESLTYPRNCISLGFLESDSRDATFALMAEKMGRLDREYRRAQLFKHDFGYHLPAGQPRWASHLQVARRSVLAKSRNHLLFRALDDEQWVLWLDVDVIDYQPDIIQRLLAVGKDIVHPNCVLEYGGPTFDQNAWRRRNRFRGPEVQYLHDLRHEGDLVPIDGVGGTMLLIRADVHRDGLIFPAFPYGLRNRKMRTRNAWKGEFETEGLGLMAGDMGVQCWGMPNLEIKHHP